MIDRRRARGDTGTEIARKLPAGARPGILYESGNISQIPLTKDDGEASINKPSGAEGLVCRLETVAGFAATGLAATSFPRGFRVLPAAWAIAAPA